MLYRLDTLCFTIQFDYDLSCDLKQFIFSTILSFNISIDTIPFCILWYAMKMNKSTNEIVVGYKGEKVPRKKI